MNEFQNEDTLIIYELPVLVELTINANVVVGESQAKDVDDWDELDE